MPVLDRLTDVAVKRTKPAGKPHKLTDGKGLYLLVNPNGSKLWRVKYRADGKEKLLALGAYPAVTLSEARTRRDEARKQLATEIDPMAQRKAIKTAKRIAASNSSFPSLMLNNYHYPPPIL